MAEYKDREHYIPLRRHDLVDLLCGDKDLPTQEREPFRQFCRLVTAIYHFQYHDLLDELKNQYAPFDPDRVTQSIRELTPDARDQQQEKFFSRFDWLLQKANYKKLTREELLKATEAASYWGINMDIDFAVFNQLDVYVRGDTVGKRVRRLMWPPWGTEEVKVPIYQRLVILMKQNKHKRLGADPDTKSIFLKVFKDMPKADVEMLLPGGRLKMPGIARGKLGASLLGTIGFVGYKLWLDLGMLVQAAAAFNLFAFWMPLSLVAGYGYKQIYGYQVSKQTYSLQLTKSLYYQSLDSNGGVLYHLLDEAEEQECREAILGYYYLWRYGGDKGWTARDLDDYVEMDLERLANLKVDFEIEDALDKLAQLGIAEQVGDRYRAVPLNRALEVMDYKWDNYFQYNKPAG
jgi:hypothetical protein